MTRKIPYVLSLMLLLCAAGSAYGQSPEVCENKLPKDPAYYADMKELPPGKFGFSYMFDKTQYDDTSALVVVRGLGGISSAKPRALKLSCVEIENRTTRVVRALQLRWVVAALAPGQNVTDKLEALAKGVLPVFEVQVLPGERRKVEMRGVHFADFFQPLAAAGEINGHFNVIIGVAHVEFTDGTSLDSP